MVLSQIFAYEIHMSRAFIVANFSIHKNREMFVHLR
jgi:hypothetical protein